MLVLEIKFKSWLELNMLLRAGWVWSVLLGSVLLMQIGIIGISPQIGVAQQSTDDRPKFDVPPTPPDGYEIYVYVNSTLAFKVQCSDPDSDEVTIRAIELPPGSSLEPPEPTGNPAVGKFSWSPTIEYTEDLIASFSCQDEQGNSVSHSIVVEVGVRCDDRDFDALCTHEERELGTDPNNPDTDGDGILDCDEDTDGDGLTNIEEINLETDFVNRDTDSDGIIDGDEQSKITIPFDDDTDNDGLRDGDELIRARSPIDADSDNNGKIDGDDIDLDNDALTNFIESLLATDQHDRDTDDDGTEDGDEDYDGDILTNSEEVIAGTDPTFADMDRDGIKDDLEDMDHDVVRNRNETRVETDTQKIDTDEDSINDWNEDSDSDGLPNGYEFETYKTFKFDPLNPDSDGDGILDGNEFPFDSIRIHTTCPTPDIITIKFSERKTFSFTCSTGVTAQRDAEGRLIQQYITGVITVPFVKSSCETVPSLPINATRGGVFMHTTTCTLEEEPRFSSIPVRVGLGLTTGVASNPILFLLDIIDEKASIIIQEATLPQDPQDFTYYTIGLGLSGFSLDSGDGSTLQNEKVFKDLKAGTFEVTQLPVKGFNTEITCNDPDNETQHREGFGDDEELSTAIIDLDYGETITCVFKNVSNICGIKGNTLVSAPYLLAPIPYSAGPWSFNITEANGDGLVLSHLRTGSYEHLENLRVTHYELEYEKAGSIATKRVEFSEDDLHNHEVFFLGRDEGFGIDKITWSFERRFHEEDLKGVLCIHHELVITWKPWEPANNCEGYARDCYMLVPKVTFEWFDRNGLKQTLKKFTAFYKLDYGNTGFALLSDPDDEFELRQLLSNRPSEQQVILTEETSFNAATDGEPGKYDNLHPVYPMTDRDKVKVLGCRDAAFDCIHQHWRWGEINNRLIAFDSLTDPIPPRPFFLETERGKNYFMPHQTVKIALVKDKTAEDEPDDPLTLVDKETIATVQKHDIQIDLGKRISWSSPWMLTAADDVVEWYVASVEDSHTATFFSHGLFVLDEEPKAPETEG